MDFTITTYENLLIELKGFDFKFELVKNYSKESSNGKIIFLRHDVDARKLNSLKFARIQKSKGVVGTYYFRIIPQSYDEHIMKEMSEMGHEIGYHYETMDTCKGNVDQAYDEFCRNLEAFRKLVEIKTICMHGSPMSKFDNRDIWKKYDYKKLGLSVEPYFDIDFNKVYYLTDTGRKWDGDKVSMRDKPMTKSVNPDFNSRNYRTTFDIIQDLKKENFPREVMMTFHPQRWSNNPALWLQEFSAQKIKNEVKKVLIAKKNFK